MTPAIVANVLSKRYGSHSALHDLDLQVDPGEIFGLIGPNGAGKTTTMRLLLDVIRPSSGSVTVLGHDPRSGGSALRRRIGYLPGELRIPGSGSGRSVLGHFARISGPVQAGTIERLAARLDLDLDRPVSKLSKGNKQKVGIIQAFMHTPELLVLDEPTSGLDPLLQQEFLSMVREARDAGQTVFLSSHVLSEIEQVADRVGILQQGELIHLGTVADLRATRQRRVRATLASPPDRAQLKAAGNISQLWLDESGGETHVSFLLEGDVDPLVKLLARFEVRDLLLEEPVLEDAVLNLYRKESA